MGLDNLLGGVALKKLIRCRIVLSNIDGQRGRGADFLSAAVDAVDGDVLPVEIGPVDVLGINSST